MIQSKLKPFSGGGAEEMKFDITLKLASGLLRPISWSDLGKVYLRSAKLELCFVDDFFIPLLLISINWFLLYARWIALFNESLFWDMKSDCFGRKHTYFHKPVRLWYTSALFQLSCPRVSTIGRALDNTCNGKEVGRAEQNARKLEKSHKHKLPFDLFPAEKLHHLCNVYNAKRVSTFLNRG